MLLLWRRRFLLDAAESLLQSTAQPLAEASASAKVLLPVAVFVPGLQGNGSTRTSVSTRQLNAVVLGLLFIDVVIFEGLFDAVAGLALALDVVGVVLDAGPAL